MDMPSPYDLTHLLGKSNLEKSCDGRIEIPCVDFRIVFAKRAFVLQMLRDLTLVNARLECQLHLVNGFAFHVPRQHFMWFAQLERMNTVKIFDQFGNNLEQAMQWVVCVSSS
jgi:hypothetical protein